VLPPVGTRESSDALHASPPSQRNPLNSPAWVLTPKQRSSFAKFSINPTKRSTTRGNQRYRPKRCSPTGLSKLPHTASALRTNRAKHRWSRSGSSQTGLPSRLDLATLFAPVVAQTVDRLRLNRVSNRTAPRRNAYAAAAGTGCGRPLAGRSLAWVCHPVTPQGSQCEARLAMCRPLVDGLTVRGQGDG
jgi:hypothetical protein